ncbi:unnamed protein product [Knipowitschia caucasica]|uniref:Uncharacterized protein n=1 Tax=Knipowitschia caucasica TaxID=637954 RepID=A0AAV2MQ68_KNICA
MARRIIHFWVCVLWSCSQSWAVPGAFFESSLDPGLNRSRRAIHCNTELEYHHEGYCCRNCPAGTHMKKPCSTPGGPSDCEECASGTYTALGNGLEKCLSCSRCRADQAVVRACESTHNIECQCKAGGFCEEDQACEVCRRCLRCGSDETLVRNCTPTRNTECKKNPPNPGHAADMTAVRVAVGLVVPLVAAVVLLIFCLHRRKKKTSDSGRTPAALTLNCNGTEKGRWSLVRPKSLPVGDVGDVEEERGLCSTSNSQDNLITSLPLFTCSAPAAPALTLPNTRVDVPQFNVRPVNGQVSLTSCFEFFEELDIHYHKRFFRHLGLSDNVIISKEPLMYVDRVHDLLNLWLERRGRQASLEDLLRALLELNQRRTAEVIVERALQAGFYVSLGDEHA